MKLLLTVVIMSLFWTEMGALQCYKCQNKSCKYLRVETCLPTAKYCVDVVDKRYKPPIQKHCASDFRANKICKRAESKGLECEKCNEDLCNEKAKEHIGKLVY